MNSLVPTSVSELFEVDDFSTIADVHTLNANESLDTVEGDTELVNLNDSSDCF